jgi:hypothetical protein
MANKGIRQKATTGAPVNWLMERYRVYMEQGLRGFDTAGLDPSYVSYQADLISELAKELVEREVAFFNGLQGEA